jgi:hypothetical protein
VALVDWSGRWGENLDPGQPVPRHAGCGAEVHAVLACERGHQRLGPSDPTAAPPDGS